MSIFGRSYGSKISGQLIKDGRTLELKRVSDAIDAKIAYVSEDRHVYGAVPDISITKNITLPSLKSFESMLRLAALVRNLAERGKVLFIVTHDYEFFCRTCTRALHLADGGVQRDLAVTEENLSAIREIFYVR